MGTTGATRPRARRPGAAGGSQRHPAPPPAPLSRPTLNMARLLTCISCHEAHIPFIGTCYTYVMQECSLITSYKLSIEKKIQYRLAIFSLIFLFSVTHFKTEIKKSLQSNIMFFYIFWGDFFFFLFVQYSALLHLPPLRFHCADGCWDRTQDRSTWCIGSQML